MAKEKKVVFSEEIDSIINGIAVGMAFLISAFITYFFNVFHNIILDRIVAVALAMLGILFTSFEIDKIDKNKIYGVGDLVLGLVFIIPSLGVILYFNNIFSNVIMSAVFIFGAYGSFRGLLEIAYSILKPKKVENKKSDIIKVITFLTEFIALIVVVMQLMTEIIKIRNQ